MTPLESAIVENRETVDTFIAVARAVDPGRWRVPRAAGKWSPAQVVEHTCHTERRAGPRKRT